MNSTPPPQQKKQRGFADLLFEELNESEKKETSTEKVPRNNSLYKMMNEMKSRISLKVEPMFEKKHIDISTVVKDYRLYSKVTIYSKIPCIWLNQVWEKLQTTQRTPKEVSLADIWSKDATKEERMSLLAGKLRHHLEYYYFTSPKQFGEVGNSFVGDKQQECASKFKTYWNAWQHFSTNQESMFFAMNKQSSIFFHQSSEYVRDLLQMFNPNLLSSLQQIREHDALNGGNGHNQGTKSAESKGRLPETTHYAILGSNRGNHAFTKMIEAAGKSLHDSRDQDVEDLPK